MAPADLSRQEGSPAGALLLTRRGCALCFALHRTAARAARRSGVRLRVIDIDTDPALCARFDREVPVLEMPDGRRLGGGTAAHEVEAAFRAAAGTRRAGGAGAGRRLLEILKRIVRGRAGGPGERV